VNNFQENENLRVFLISLKAGGTGLNLTAADYVYIVDPWWNPAVENQAIDRCYRIGQDKKVFAYRMICKNTVEEKIVSLQNKKKKIAGDIIQTDENILAKFDKNDIAELFS
jgi:SNF2 family DNA or RNA helicase